MIIVASPSKPFAYTDKGSVKRQITLQLYDDEIESAYAAVENSSQTDIEPPSNWDRESTHNFVKKVVIGVIGHEIHDGDDIFQHGGDRCALHPGIFLRLRLMRSWPTQLAGNLDPQHDPPRPPPE